ncbi:MAG TPA: hypothetical protein VMT55_04995, partial [Candidatus Sulfotelmatobacter sp.]|nr:hypothetical protein [Candidatus Sulfotelmatobacter sp.]
MSRLRLTVFLIGVIAVTAQTLLIRELIDLLTGNELLYGLTICLWLIGYAAGSGLLGGLADRIKKPALWLNILLPAAALLLPAGIFLTRAI